MKLNKLSFIKWLLLVAYTVIAYIFTLKSIQPELLYHLQQPPFLMIYDFFHEYLLYPGGVSDYLASFYMQSFYYGWLGAIVIVANSLLLIVLAYYILKQIFAKEYLVVMAFLPSVLSISLLNGYTFPYTVMVKILLSYFMLFLYLLNKNEKYSIVIYTFFAVFIYYVAGSGSFLTFSVSVLAIELFRNLYKKRALYLFYILAFVAVMPFFSYRCVFNIPPSAKYLYFLPDLPKFISYSGGTLYYIFCYSLPLIIIVCIVIFFIISRIKFRSYGETKWYTSKSLILVICIIIITSISVISFGLTKDKHAKNKILADYYSYGERWDKVIDIAISDSKYDVFINYHYNRAINNIPGFVDSFFNYKQFMGANGLFPDKYNAKEIALLSSDYYYDLGYIGLSQLWANEALTVFHYSPRILKRLFTTNIILGNYDEARKYLEILNENFLCQSFVEENMPLLDDTMLIYKDKVLMEKRSFSPYKLDVSGIDMAKRFNDLLNTNVNNKMAFDHLQMHYLLELKLGDFYKNVPYTFNYYKKMPETFELATMVYLAQVGKFDFINNKNFSESALGIFRSYTETLKSFQNNKIAAKSTLNSRFGNTYLYYIMFDCPLVTKFKIKGRPVNTHQN